MVLEPYLLVAVLQQEIQLPEDLGDVSPVNLVYHQKVLGIGIFLCIPFSLLSGAQQRPVLQLESRLPSCKQGGTEPLHEVLVGVGRVELHQGDPLLRPGQMLGQFLCDVRLPRPRRPLEYHLLLLLQQRHDIL